MKTKSTYGNCVFGALYLLMRNKVKQFHLVSSINHKVPFHVVAETKTGNYLHFIVDTVDQNPTYFKGNFEAIGKSKGDRLMKKSGRVKLTSLSPKMFLTYSVIGIIMLSVPWTLQFPAAVIFKFIKSSAYCSYRASVRSLRKAKLGKMFAGWVSGLWSTFMDELLPRFLKNSKFLKWVKEKIKK